MIKDLPKRLKELRIENKLSQKEVAQKLGLSPSVVSGYETGERTPSTDVILSLSFLYKCTTDYLLGKSNESPKVLLNTDGLNKTQIRALQSLIDVMKQE